MNDRKDSGHGGQQPAGIKLGDIYYVIFRHKWKIVILALLGFLAAGVILAFKKPLYGSEAELLVRYVLDTKPKEILGNVKNTDPRGDNIINSEVRIITSFDVSSNVVNAIGAKRILARENGGDDPVWAAKLIRKNIIVEPIKRTDVLRIAFEHKDREIVQPVLTQLILSYLSLHARIHGDLGISDAVLNQRVSVASNQLAQTEILLRAAKLKAGVVSIQDAQKMFADQITKKAEDISNAEAELAQRVSTLNEVAKTPPANLETTNITTEAPVPLEQSNEYRALAGRLDALLRKRDELRTQFTETSIPVREVQQQIVEIEQTKKNLEGKYPGLTAIPMAVPSSSTAPSSSNVFDPATEAIQVRGLRSRLAVLNSQLAHLKAESARIEEMESTITELQRKKDIQETEYRSYEGSLNQARFNQALEAGKLSNINVTQEPTPPYKDADQIQKMAMVAAGGGLLGGLLLAFAWELFLNTTVKRPDEVENKLHLPLMLSIPDTAQKGFELPGANRNLQLQWKPPGDAPSEIDANNQIAVWDDDHSLHLYFETLRDRLFNYFEAHKLTHNPKLVAVTSCSDGAGVSTVAAGLAATLSETGEGNVLLVNMNNGQSSARPFFKGKPAVGLAEALQADTRADAKVQENLYVVSEGVAEDKLPSALPKQFAQLMPQLKASDYDYIIFDMPPVTQISVSNKLARLMDINLLVVESEKTDRDIVRKASAMLAGTKSNLGVVLNKKRTYVPKWLLQEL